MGEEKVKKPEAGKVEGKSITWTTLVQASLLLLAGFGGSKAGTVNWADKTIENGNKVAALKAEFDAHRASTSDKLDRIDGMLTRIWSDLQQRKEGEP